MPAFTNTNNQETLSKEIINRNPVDLIVALIALALTYGVDRVEAAIKATYTKSDAFTIIQMMNFTLDKAA